MVNRFAQGNWQHAVGSSGTARALAEIIKLNGFGEEAITPAGVDRLRAHLIRAGDMGRAELAGLRPDRVPVLPGGVAIMNAVLSELRIDSMVPAAGAMREGVLYDMLGRFHNKDMRDITVAQFMQRYHVDAPQARRVGALALKLYDKFAGADADETAPRYLAWAAKLHEIGISVAYSGYHRHSAYIINHAEMPGFSRDEQTRLAALVLAHRRSLKKVAGQIEGQVDWAAVLALRLAALFCKGRTDTTLPPFQGKVQGRRFRLEMDTDWLQRFPLTAGALNDEAREWDRIGRELKIPGIEETERAVDMAIAD
jgi:exopolyphosphatase/guanosine-5'-triphosphate,3'-diphosphate pyrophosphatase